MSSVILASRDCDQPFAKLCPDLCDPMDYCLPGSSIHGIFQARILERVTIPFSEDLPDPGIEPRSSALQADSLPSEPPGKQSRNPAAPLTKTMGLYFAVFISLPSPIQKHLIFSLKLGVIWPFYLSDCFISALPVATSLIATGFQGLFLDSLFILTAVTTSALTSVHLTQI